MSLDIDWVIYTICYDMEIWFILQDIFNKHT